nr:zinc finger MYM-type protein 1-like [Ipomoea batatas]GME10639.1 zinc finger MYM-type protein 1-like [Ipomoea batatas]
MKKTQRIDLFFKRKNSEDSTSQVNPFASIEPLNSESRPEKAQRVEINEKFDTQALERDPGLRLPIWKCPIDKRDEVRRAYIKADPYQCLLSKYPKSGERHPQLLSIVASFNDEVTKVLDKAPRNASYTSPTIQKQILQVLATKVKSAIREEIGDAKFCIIVDEARDESKKEQMSIVLRFFVDRDGFIQERFFGVVHVKDTSASTLKECIFSILSRHNLDVQNIRGQGYDGAGNMRGEWNGLKALILDECPYAYYVHCFAHRLQLALVASSKEVIPVHQFFTKLNSIINIVGASCKRNDQLKAAHASNIAHLLSIDELESGRGLNQIGSLQRSGDTRWSSHLKSISSLMRMFSATCEVLLNIIEDGTTHASRGDADTAYEVLTSFEFVFIMHLMKKVLEISNMLCQALQLQSQDILNAMHLVSSTKLLIQTLRDSGWDELVASVKSFCETVNITVPDFDAQYTARR